MKMRTFKLRISTPDGDLFSGEAVKITLRGAEGDLAILKDHIPFVTSVMPGKCVVTLSGGEEKEGKTDGGLLTVSKDIVTLLSGSFSW
ncbi:MAG: F0F1 ATP synthase subunit epsilon [Ruminococcaceae bacterium]|nr:F0F1 ATP synthase subunit epsilon [Oscillospiraceae bacterium]